MISFIEEYRVAHGVEPICRVLPIAPSTFYAHATIARDPDLASDRAKQDAIDRKKIKDAFDGSGKRYGARKIWHDLRRPPKGCIHHTDRGSQYCSHDYQKILRQHGFRVSMSGTGNCYDNAAVETFFKTIKAELLWHRSWRSRRDAELAIFEYINGFYNPRRRHSALGWKSPLAFERKVA